MINLILKLMESEALKTAFLKLANMSISASWLVLAILVLRLVLKKAPKWGNVLLWGIVAVRLICPFTIESALSLIPSTQTIPMSIEMAAKPAIDSGVEVVNILVTFTGGFDMEKYLAKQTCADFIVSSTDYFRYNQAESFITREQIAQVQANTTQSLSGCGYQLTGTTGWMTEEAWRMDRAHFGSPETVESELATYRRRGDLVGERAQIEGLDESLFEKVTLVEGDLAPLFRQDSNAIAMVVDTDDYGNVEHLEYYPEIGTTQTITYVDDAYYIDKRTGEKCDTNTTPLEFLEYFIAESHDVEYTVCAYVIVPHSMSYRYGILGYRFVLPVGSLAEDSRKKPIPMFYLFDTPDAAAEEAAERYLAQLTAGELSALMYESKATLRAEFESFQTMFLLLGGLLCAIIGLIGILNFFNAIMTGILSRRREFAVLQAVGMTNRQLKTMLIYEGLFYALGSSVTALILSILMNPLIVRMLESMFWFFSANFTILPVLLVIPIFALLGFTIPSIMYRQATKQANTYNILSYDNFSPSQIISSFTSL